METQQPHWVLGSQDSDNAQSQVKNETGNPKDSEHVLPSLKTPQTGKGSVEGVGVGEVHKTTTAHPKCHRWSRLCVCK